MSSERIDFANGIFDLVLSIEVLEHVQDVHLAVAEIGRVLRPGGLAVITTPCANRSARMVLQQTAWRSREDV